MSFQIALSGLTAATTKLDVISNNVANSGTYGFKKSFAEFADLYASTFVDTPKTTGQGVKVAAVTQRFKQGGLESTDNSMDLAISGEGFFRMNDGGKIIYTRAGAFGFDKDGYIVNSTNQRLTGYQADATGTISKTLDDLHIDMSEVSPQATGKMSIAANLDARATGLPNTLAFDPKDTKTYNNTTSAVIYDSLGTSHIANWYFRKDAGATNQWTSYLYVDGQAVSPAGGDALTFKNDGTLNTIAGASADPTTKLFPSLTRTYTPSNGAAPMNLALDYGNFTQYGSPFGINAISQDGYATGRLGSIKVDNTGVISGTYSNGQIKNLGQVSLTSFANPQGLRKLGNASWAESHDSGEALTAAPSTGSLGIIQSSALEQSNVDLTKELVDLIGAQRTYQANAQVISTDNQISQTIINLR